MSELIVSKYGGSSIASAEGIEKILEITKDNSRRKVIVVSAPGKRREEDTRVTQMLVKLAENYDQSLKDKILERYSMYSSSGLKKKEINSVTKILEDRLNQNLPEEARNNA